MNTTNPEPIDALILAAGKSKRMGGQVPKVLLPLGRGHVIDYVLEQAFGIGCRTVGVVVGFQAESVRDYLEGKPVTIVHQREQLGTGHAVMVSEPHFGGESGHLLVLNGDVPLLRRETLSAMLNQHLRDRPPATLITTDLPDPTGYGRIIRTEGDRVERIVEEKDATLEERLIREVNAGIYLFQKKNLFHALRYITCHNRANEYYLTDVIGVLTAESLLPAPFLVQDWREVLGMNTPEEYATVKQILATRTQSEEVHHG